jgi:hypothetical protein
MNERQASEILGTPSDASRETVESRYKELYSDFQVRITNAATSELKRLYQSKLQEIEQAWSVLEKANLGSIGISIGTAKVVEDKGYQVQRIPPGKKTLSKRVLIVAFLGLLGLSGVFVITRSWFEAKRERDEATQRADHLALELQQATPQSRLQAPLPDPLQPRPPNSSPPARSDASTRRPVNTADLRNKTPVLVECDADCAIKIDGATVGSLKQNDSKQLLLSSGDHLLEASAQGTRVTWRKPLALHGTDQILVTTELEPLLLAAKAQWLLGTWARNDDDRHSNDRTCYHYYSRSGEMKIYLRGNQIIGNLSISGTGVFPNSKYYADVCTAEIRIFPDYQISFSFIVSDFSAHSAAIKLTGVLSCEPECTNLRNNMQKYPWKLEARSGNELSIDVVSDRVNGTFTR